MEEPELEKVLMRKSLSVVMAISILTTGCDQLGPAKTSNVPKVGLSETPVSAVDEAFLVIKEIGGKAPIWKFPGALSTKDNQIIEEITQTTTVQLFDSVYTDSGAIYYQVATPEGVQGYLARTYLYSDQSGKIFYEGNRLTGELLEDGKNYSLVNSDNEYCQLLSVAISGDVEKDEFETTAEFEKRRDEAVWNNPWISSGITYVFSREETGRYDADTERYTYDSLVDVDAPWNSTRYVEVGPDLSKCIDYYRGDVNLRFKGSVVGDTKDLEYLKVEVPRSIAKDWKVATVFFGIKVTGYVDYERAHWDSYTTWERENNRTNYDLTLEAELSFAGVASKDGKKFIKTVFGEGFQRTWKTDLQSQLAILGYDVGSIDGSIGMKTEKAVQAAFEDGYLNSSRIEMKQVLSLILAGKEKRDSRIASQMYSQTRRWSDLIDPEQKMERNYLGVISREKYRSD